MNSTLLAKQAWRIIQSPDALGIKVLKALYFPNFEFVTTKRKRNKSWAWANIIQGRDMILKSAKWEVGARRSYFD